MEPPSEVAAGGNRRSMRLKNRDYALPGPYFLTICTNERRCVFGSIANGSLLSSALGHLVRECWVAIPEHFPRATLHEFVIMPNHLHGVIALSPHLHGVKTLAPLVGAQHCCALPGGATANGVAPGSLGAIVRSFKAIVARRAHKELGWRGPLWQRNYFERVLRDGKESSDVSRYIAENPKQWKMDRENPEFK